MSGTDTEKGNWKKKIFHEVTEYWINVCYLTIVFAAFTQYRRFLLAAHDITFGKGSNEILANSLIVFVAFIPFFAIKESGRVWGEDKVRALFFRSRTDKGSGSPGPGGV